MPLYDYRCQQCQSVSELLIMSSSTTAACPQCGSEAMEKLLSAPVPPGRSKALIASSRARAAREGHFSNYSPSEIPKR
jgi:putative FmdB family regulatory protein